MAGLGKKRVTRSLGGNLLSGVFLVLLGAFMGLPLVYAILNAFKPINELFLFPPRFFPRNPTFDNFLNLVKLQGTMLVPIERYVFNSVFVSIAATGLYLVIASMAAYPMAKHTFLGKTLILQVVVWAILFRPEVTAIPQYIVISGLGLVDTYLALILPILATSFGVFLIRQFMTSVPDDIIESARVDGTGEFMTLWRIVMPMIKPAWLTLLIFTFQAIWNATGVQYIYTENLKLLPTALAQLVAAGVGRAGVAAAVAVILLLPPVTLFVLIQGSVIETMSHSGIKE